MALKNNTLGRVDLKKLACVLFFQLISQCLDILMKVWYISHAMKFFLIIYTSNSTINIMSAHHRIVMSFSNMSSAFVEDIKNMLFYTFFSKPQNWKTTILIKVFYQILQLLFSLFIVFKRWYVISRPCFNDCSPDGFPP